MMNGTSNCASSHFASSVRRMESPGLESFIAIDDCTLDRSGTPHSANPPRHVLYLIDKLANLEGGAEGTILKLCRLLPDRHYRCSVVTFFAGENV